MAEKLSQSSDGSRPTVHGSNSQSVAPVSTSERLKPVCFSNEVTTASPAMLGESVGCNSENKPVEQESEQDTLIGSGEAAAAVGAAAKKGHSPDVAPRLDSHYGEEKRDQSKEEPSLELRQQEGWCEGLGGMLNS